MKTDLTTTEQATPAPRQPRPLRHFWIVLALIFTALCVIQSGHQLWQSSGLPTGRGQIGLGRDQSCVGMNFCRVEIVQPGSAAERADIRVGDMLALERPLDDRRALRVGEILTVIRQEAGGDRRIAITAAPGQPKPVPEYFPATALFILAGLMGGLVIARSGGRRALVLIGLAYASYAITGQWPRLWQAYGDLYAWFYVVLNIIYYGSPLLFLAGARALRQEVSGRDPWIIRLAFCTLIVAQGALLTYQLHAELTGREGLFGHNAFLAYTLPVFVGYALAAVVLWQAWREAPPEARSRYGMMLIAIGATFLSGVFDMGILLTGNDYTSLSPLLVGWHLAFLMGMGLFGYAILRHRVVDLGFAVNRTLVYGALSSTLLLTFFFLEWGAEQIIPSGMREASLIVSAGIALMLFLVFERVRRWVERGVETLFFRSWRENEARLNRFLKDAAFVSRTDALVRAALAELVRYTGGAAAGLYRTDETGALRADAAVDGLPQRLEADARILVRLRAEREPLDGDLAETIGAALVLPMVQRAEVRGLILIGPKPSGEEYRPDEREALARAAQRVGMDLHALEIDRLERQVRTLDAQIAVLKPQRVRTAGRSALSS